MSAPEALASPPLETPWVPLWPLTPLAPTTMPGCRLYRSAGAAAMAIPNNAFTACNFDAERWDTDAMHDSAAGVNSRITIKTPGKYEFGGMASFAPQASGNHRLIGFLLNGVASIGMGGTVATFGAGANRISASTIWDCVAGDYIELVLFQDSGGGLDASSDLSAGPEFWAQMLTPNLLPAPGASAPGYGTSLPANPFDGQEHILVDSVSNPTYQWRFRYNASSTSPYKWEFVGGTPLTAYVQTQQGASLNTYSDLATAGPTVTTPRAGDYQIEFGAMFVQNGSSGVHGYASVAIGAAAAADGDAAGYASMGNGVLAGGPARQLVKTGLAAATPLKMQYRGSAAVPWLFRERRISILPVRVS